MEALGMTATCYGDIHKYMDDLSYSHAEPSYKSTSPLEILERVKADKHFNGLFATRASNNLEILFREREAALLNHWNAWKIEDPTKQFRDSQEAAVAIVVGTRTEKYDFFLAQLLITSHAVRVILPFLPSSFHIPLIRQWWLLTVAIYIAQLRPEIRLDHISGYDTRGRDWEMVARYTVKGQYWNDPQYVKAIHAFKEAAQTWGDRDNFFLKAAVKFIDEFNGWDGFI
jgi:Questin oxidase-like